MNNKRQFALVLLAVACFAATQTQGRPSGEPEILDADDADTSVAEQLLNAMAETEDGLDAVPRDRKWFITGNSRAPTHSNYRFHHG
ncbi:hypothetical protein BOX15_Mlig034053g2 [Macrostomum lignano]|uniref:Uncharacterized protein n=1 Tax=Macrostomum lignano TaxID=282301 RepID=A0A267FRE3_9PLAT|nr:hypothetical protein BOX15_Mlig034053g2 [Macrostomum lignano]